MIYTVDVAKFTQYLADEQVAIFDICVDDNGYIHMRVNNGLDEAVVVLTKEQCRRARNILDKAIDGLVELKRT